MLKHLKITNFAIIDTIEIDFYSGFTVLTGETGAGKSILIDAISLLLGDRASQEMVRSGETTATIEAIFEYDHEQIRAKLNKLGIDTFDNEIKIYREITTQNKNIVKLNNISISIQDLKDITKNLSDVHSQFDTQRLINPSSYVELIDGFKRQMSEQYLDEYHDYLAVYKDKLHVFNNLSNTKKELNEKLEIYQYQLKDILKYKLSADEVDTLQEQENVLSNFDNIFSHLREAKSILEDQAMMDMFYQVFSSLERLSSVSKDFLELTQRTENYYYEMDDISHQINQKIDSMNFDPDELESIQERLHELQSLQEKYHMTIPELIEHTVFLENAVDQTVNFDEYIEKAKIELQKAFENVLKSTKNLTSLRIQVSEKITKELKNVLKDLVLPNTEFKIDIKQQSPKDMFDSSKFLNHGIDEIEFFISTNLGEPLKPLSKTASGGEMSRIMLAFKAIFIRSQNLSTIIFDEIDTGISGYVAKQIACKMQEISEFCQVISITHIPQVVAKGKYHLKVEKHEIKNRTVAKAYYLDLDSRIKEIAHMISGDKLSEASIQSAKELLINN
ncbi:MAG: DNA repair protein RecN [Candidatus Izemoplasmatales bacterium]|jgi:DNA repair protein RecN (Recombination protein N)|nr:DNA repair protein RecN [Candidatus Izemoplasmatales bacterium]